MPTIKPDGNRVASTVLVPVLLVMVVLLIPVVFISNRPAVSPYIVAVPADAPSLSSPVSRVFSRAPYFVVYDVQNARAKYLVNGFANGTHEVGLHVAHLLTEEQVGVVIAKNVGPEPYRHLAQNGVKVYEGLAIDVQDAISKYTGNMLILKTGPTGFARIFPAQ